MAEDAGTATVTDNGKGGDEAAAVAAAAATLAATKTDADIEAIAGKADNPDAVRNALQAERAAAREAAQERDALRAKVQEYEDKNKTEQERATDKANQAEARAAAAEAKLERYQVAVNKNLPLELADRLQGSTKRELEADADRLLQLVKDRAGRPSGDADAGRGEAAEAKSFNDILRGK